MPDARRRLSATTCNASSRLGLVVVDTQVPVYSREHGVWTSIDLLCVSRIAAELRAVVVEQVWVRGVQHAPRSWCRTHASRDVVLVRRAVRSAHAPAGRHLESVCAHVRGGPVRRPAPPHGAERGRVDPPGLAHVPQDRRRSRSAAGPFGSTAFSEALVEAAERRHEVAHPEAQAAAAAAISRLDWRARFLGVKYI